MRYSAGYLTFSVSIHAPRMGRDLFFENFLVSLGVSIHAPRMGRD